MRARLRVVASKASAPGAGRTQRVASGGRPSSAQKIGEADLKQAAQTATRRASLVARQRLAKLREDEAELDDLVPFVELVAPGTACCEFVI